MIDVITNSSTELFVASEEMVEPAFRELFKSFMEYCDGREIDFESQIYSLKSYENEMNCKITFKKELERDKIWLIEASYHNDFLNLFLTHVHPLMDDEYEIKWVGEIY